MAPPLVAEIILRLFYIPTCLRPAPRPHGPSANLHAPQGLSWRRRVNGAPSFLPFQRNGQNLWPDSADSIISIHSTHRRLAPLWPRESTPRSGEPSPARSAVRSTQPGFAQAHVASERQIASLFALLCSSWFLCASWHPSSLTLLATRKRS